MFFSCSFRQFWVSVGDYLFGVLPFALAPPPVYLTLCGFHATETDAPRKIQSSAADAPDITIKRDSFLPERCSARPRHRCEARGAGDWTYTTLGWEIKAPLAPHRGTGVPVPAFPALARLFEHLGLLVYTD